VISYRVTFAEPRKHRFLVTMQVESFAGEVLFSMPAWIPGSYLLRDFARHVAVVRARRDGQSVAVTKLDSATWSCPAGGGHLVVELEIFAFDLSVRGAYLDDRRGFFNGTCLFPWVHGRTEQPLRMIIDEPDLSYCEGWRVATAMTALEVDECGFGIYEAEDYDELVDHPVEIGSFDRQDFTAGGVRHHLVVAGHQEADFDRLTTDLIQLCDTQIDFFGRPAPVNDYWFLGLATANGYGGLEHRASSSLIFSRDDLPAVGRSDGAQDYRRLLGLFSHEYFHAWLIKRIRPAAFTPYEFQRRNYTRLLWLFEGFTTYYQNLLLLRADLLGVPEYLDLLSETLTRVYQTPGRFSQSAADSSFDAWDKLYKPTADSANAGISYYAKGAVVALGLDLNIRLQTEGRASLDDVVRLMWEQYGVSGSSGLAEHGFEALLRQATGEDFTLLLDQLVNGSEDPPLADWLAQFGVTMNFEPRQLDLNRTTDGVELGLSVTNESGVIRARQVTAGGTAEMAGVAPGDEVIAINGLRVRSAKLGPLLARSEAGDAVSLILTRGDEVIEREGMLQPAAMHKCTLKEAETSDADSTRRRIDWLGD
jgi:predicted metalloprotease with PDZ domain